eukprot:5889706-Amphidinium_carterae.1
MMLVDKVVRFLLSQRCFMFLCEFPAPRSHTFIAEGDPSGQESIATHRGIVWEIGNKLGAIRWRARESA